MPDANGQFFVKSFYNVLTGADVWMFDWRNFWNSYVPPRVLSFCWVACLQKILTMDQVRRKNYIIVNKCPLCLNEEETTYHLLIHSKYAHEVWVSIVDMFDMSWAMPCTVMELFQWWKYRASSIQGCIYDSCLFMLVFGRFGWREIIEFLEIKANLLMRSFGQLFGMFRSELVKS